MSGRPCNNPRDAEKYRKQYLAMLDVMIANDEKNLQANLLHKRTGQLTSQINDYRTTTQKLADATLLRVDLKRQLRRICDMSNANQIIQQLSDDDVRFVAQHIDQIVKDLQPKNRYGVEAPTFMVYLRKLMKVETETTAGTLTASPVVADEVESINLALPTAEQLMQLKDLVEHVVPLAGSQSIDEFVDIIHALTAIQATIQTVDYDPIIIESVGNSITQVTKDLPARAEVQRLLTKLRELQGDTDAFEEKYAEFVVKLPDDLLQDNLQTLGDIQSYLQVHRTDQASVDTEARPSAPSIATANVAKGSQKTSRGAPSTISSKVSDTTGRREAEGRLKFGSSASEASYEEVAELPYLPDPEAIGRRQKKIFYDIEKAYKPYFEKFGMQDITEFAATRLTARGEAVKQKNPRLWYQTHIGTLRDIQRSLSAKNRLSKQVSGDSGLGGGGAADAEIDTDPLAPRSRLPSSGGYGIAPKRRIKGKGLTLDETKGVHKKVIYAPFGRYFINLTKLDSDIICFSREKGTNIPSLKTQRVSEGLAGVFRKMVNGGTPSFNDLSALSRNDTQLYADILRKCHITSGEGIDIPNIDDKTDLNRFEIMKGEILSGSDSTTLIKEFKLLIIKLIHSGRLPKSEGKDLLVSLAELGY